MISDPLELPASPAESFSEVTKQFYHRPSKKKGIFDKRKLKFSQNPYQARLGFIGKSEGSFSFKQQQSESLTNMF